MTTAVRAGSNMQNEKIKRFTFIDLFAGIGGFHLALHELGGECLYASEWDEYARKTYEHNFKEISSKMFEKGLFRGDITVEHNKKAIPSHSDILCAGFPCQPFSQVGYKKGFNETRGALFFEIAEIIKEKKPRAIFLENVRHLLNHDEGKTFKRILHILHHELGYSIFHKIIKASDYGLPTYRPRIFIIGFTEDLNVESFHFPSPVPLKYNMSHIFGGKCNKKIGYTLRVGGRRSGVHDRRNWDAYIVDEKVRFITHKEAKKMMGFSDHFIFPVSEAESLKQLGNSVAIDPVKMTAKAILNALEFKDIYEKGK